MKMPLAVLIALFCIPLVEAEETPKLDLNTATLSQLDRLPGIGPVIAERILELRKKSGPFKRIEDLMNIQGIGEKKFLRLKDLITVKPPRQESDGNSEISGVVSLERRPILLQSRLFV